MKIEIIKRFAVNMDLTSTQKLLLKDICLTINQFMDGDCCNIDCHECPANWVHQEDCYFNAMEQSLVWLLKECGEENVCKHSSGK